MTATPVLLGSYPTPVERVGRLWVKRDDLTNAAYGGNKVRKLERLFDAARAAGKRRILTVGAVGSHQVVATALFGKQLGFDVEAVLGPQPASDHARVNISAALAHGLRAHPVSAWSFAPLALARAYRRDASFVPLGGSSTLGTLGFVDAARELMAQVAAGDLPEPDLVVVALGSGGTAAGLAVGFEAASAKTQVIGVAISQPTFALEPLARRLARATARIVGVSEVNAARRLTVLSDWLGSGYGYPTPAGAAATVVASRARLTLDPTYTAKSFACALSFADGPQTILYWHTLSAVTPAERETLPASIESLLR